MATRTTTAKTNTNECVIQSTMLSLMLTAIKSTFQMYRGVR
ncbi:hypothetical protein [uncultured Ruminococcus sp.]|nr:hypothetical protein [uncultured Ruminococcus sp.]